MSNPVSDLKRELLAAAERQSRLLSVPEQPRRFGGRVFAMRAVPVAATLAVAVAVALFVTAPWSSSPSFLARAAAALTPPEGTVLHMKVGLTTPCNVTRTAEIWVDEQTRRYRGLFRDPFSPYPFRFFTLAEVGRLYCLRGSAYEAGGIPSRWGSSEGPLRFVPPNRLVVLPAGGIGQGIRATWALDPVADLRRAIRAGRARDEGGTKLRGRVVERIRISPCATIRGCPQVVDDAGGAGYAYVDPDTFYPVEIRQDGNVTRFAVFEYLPRSAANLALTNIRAQHPRATGP
jgi:hypothetical protein